MEGGKWRGLIERAWVGRQHGNLPADEEEVRQRRELIRYMVGYLDPKGFQNPKGL